MSLSIQHLIDNNRAWVQERLSADGNFFSRLADGQHPKYLWIGCSDSRVPPDQITKTDPGEIFVTRNIANLVVQTDMNMLSVLQYAVEVLKVEHVIVCGHYGCGGVKAAMTDQQYGLIDNWLRQIKDNYKFYWEKIKDLEGAAREDRMVELNVVEQVYNVGKTSIIQNAWKNEQRPYLHGWVYDLRTGYVHEQTPPIMNNDGIEEICKFATSQIAFKLQEAENRVLK